MRYEIWVASMDRIGSAKKIYACHMAGNAKTFYQMTSGQIQKMGLFEKDELALIRAWKETKDPEVLETDLKEQEVRFTSILDDDYPEKLRYIHRPPFALFYKGKLPGPNPAVSIVGARMCSEYGRSISRVLGRELGKRGVNVISGLARGVDSAAHAGALEVNGTTFAVLGCGCDVIYPKSSRNIYHNMLKEGGILSEYYPGTQPLSFHFPERNRIISALADLVIVVEAKERSGSLITADFALEQGKDIYAVPGRYDDALSKGCNRLIAQGAGILYDVEVFLNNLGMFTQQIKLTEKNENFLLEKDELMLYSCLDLHPKSINQLLDETGMHLLSILHAADGLKHKGMVQEVFQNYYCRVI